MDVCLVHFLCCQAEISATGPSLVQRSPADCSVCLSVIKWKIETLYTYCEQIGRRGKDYKTKQNKKQIFIMSSNLRLSLSRHLSFRFSEQNCVRIYDCFSPRYPWSDYPDYIWQRVRNTLSPTMRFCWALHLPQDTSFQSRFPYKIDVYSGAYSIPKRYITQNS
jgi:hypothetical protein